MSFQACLILGGLAGGLLLDGIDFLTYSPPGPVGFERQVGLLGMLGRALWGGALIGLAFVIAIKSLA